MACVVALGVAIAPSFACGPVIGAQLSVAPVNTCGAGQLSCDVYLQGGAPAKPLCTRDEVASKTRCEFAGSPDYAFTIVVNVPDSSYYAAGRTFVLTNGDLVLTPGTTGKCKPPKCIPLPPLVAIEGQYLTSSEAAAQVGIRTPPGTLTSIPVNAMLIPLAANADVEAFGTGIPVQDVLTSSRLVRKTVVAFLDTIAIGRYQRVAYPQPPFDAYFPPAFTPLVVADAVSDQFKLGTGADGVTLDDPTGVTRTSTITRLEGLDGWKAWLADEPEYGGRRISSLKTLSGTTATVTLHTIGASQAPSTALRARTEIIVAPPAGWLGVPRLESAIFNGDPAGFRTLTIPALKTPVVVSGVVGQGATTLTGVPSRIQFTSTTITTVLGDPTPTLRYETSVSTDDAGRFQTVLPEGSYDVVIEPAEGTGLAKMKDTLQTALTVSKTFRPPPRTSASGQAVLSDGRPLSEATVLALPSEIPLVGRAVKPRPARTRTRVDGSFTIEVDQGEYTLMIDPLPGTDFPRVVQARSFNGTTADIGRIVVQPPLRLAFTLKDPSEVGNPIIRANVSVYAEIPGRGPPAVEMGRAVTDTDGYVEILLAPQTR